MPLYNSFKVDTANGDIDLTNDTINVMLVQSAYTPNIDTHTRRSDITNEASGAGYSSGGATLAGKSVSQDNTNDRMEFTANDVTFSASTITARYAVFYKSTGVAANDNLIGYSDFGGDESSVAGDFTLQNIILRLS